MTPLGKPETASCVLPVNPYSGLKRIEAEADDPWPRFKDALVDKVNVGTKTASGKLVLSFSDPEVPVTMTVLAPSLAELLAVNVSRVYPVAGLGANDAVTPLGNPEIAS